MIEAMPAAVRNRLLTIRALILDTAARTDGVGQIEEALRWNEPAYLTSETGSGSTVRINARGSDGRIAAIYFNCNTDLVESFRRLYPDSFAFEANRAVVLAADAPIPRAELAHCLSLALTYHARRKPKRGRPRKAG
ncbi:MAG: DUF1801 domain-containing protein [Rhizobiaceae bacterium]|nr:DUF1801 domain-containing protein [Rhizobiaceae bacterium]